MMTAKELITMLERFNPNQEIVLFDENSIPYKVKTVFIDEKNDGCFSHLIISADEQ